MMYFQSRFYQALCLVAIPSNSSYEIQMNLFLPVTTQRRHNNVHKSKHTHTTHTHTHTRTHMCINTNVVHHGDSLFRAQVPERMHHHDVQHSISFYDRYFVAST